MMRLFADLLLYSTLNDMLVESSQGMIDHKYKQDSTNGCRYPSIILTSYFSSMQSMPN